MSTNHKFPEKYSDSTPDCLFYYYEAPDVEDWFKRCMDDFPYIKNYDDPTNQGLIMAYDRTAWFARWFLQFRDE